MRHLFPAAAIAISLLAPAVAHADAVLDRMIADSARAPIPAFERTTRAELRAHPEKEPALVVDRFNPRDARSGSWTLVSIDGRKPTQKEMETHAKGSRDAVIPGFHRLNTILRATPTRRSEANGQTLYFWQSLPDGVVETPGGDISGKLSAEMVVEQVDGKPVPVRVRIFAAKPFKVKGIATMNSFEVVSHYRAGESFPILASQSAASDVSAPFGFGGKRKSQISFRPI